jgi:predicted DNA-binding transcriptional regulator AlpA
MNDESTPRKRQAQPLEAASNPQALLRIATVAAVTGVCERSIWQWVSAGTFPQPVTVGKRGKRWRAREVHAWNEARQERETAP